MSDRIGFGSGTDIAALYIADDNQSFFPAVIYRTLIYEEPFNAELFIHRNLRLHRRNQIADMVYNLFVESPDSFRRPFHCFAVFRKSLLLQMLRNIFQHRIKPDYNRRSCPLYVLNQFIYHVTTMPFP